MVKCGRCWLHYGLICMNVLINLCGAAIIIYSLWLEKHWYLGVADLPSVVNLPRPWFIYISLSVGMAVCLTTIFAHTIRNCVNDSALCIYVVSVSCLLILEVTVFFLVFFKIKWSELIAEYIDEDEEEFKNFVVFHIAMCRLIIILIAVLQVIIIVLALILWAIGGTEQSFSRQSSSSSVPHFKQSFLICPPNAPLLNESSAQITNDDGSSLPFTLQICAKCAKFCGRNPQDSFVSYIKSKLIIRFRRRTTVDIE